MKKKLINIIILLLLFTGFLGVYYVNPNREEKIEESNNMKDFNTSIIKKSFKEENYLISPYSIEVALNMLKEGAQGETKEEIEKLVGIRDLNINNDNVKIANALFVKSLYNKIIENNFKNKLQEKYSSEILYDEFKTPDIINNWVNNKTNGMIEKILDDISLDFILGLANAVAIDAKWSSSFECNNTTSEKFVTATGRKINVEMMHQSYLYNAKYLVDDELKGVLLPYEEGLEFIGILPNETLENYIKKLDINLLNEKIDNFEEATDKKRLSLSIPRFTYNYDLSDFKEILISIGITSAFNSELANFNSIITKSNMNKNGINNMYVSDAIHKTYIDLNEKGTKAAAVTYFGIKANSAVLDNYKEVKIEFNRPFIYMIRDKESKEILFFGSVYEPNIWKSSTCENIED